MRPRYALTLGQMNGKRLNHLLYELNKKNWSLLYDLNEKIGIQMRRYPI
jgi:hypothetical protein